jgi:hypothetical protein
VTSEQLAAATQASHVVCCLCGVHRLKRIKTDGAWTPWMCFNHDCWQRLMSWAVTQTSAGKAPTLKKWLFCPVPKQVVFLERARALRKAWAVAHAGLESEHELPATRILYGGAAGASKSYGLRWSLYRDCLLHRDMNCLLLRRTFKQLKDTHLRQMEREQHQIGANYLSGDREMKFPQTGSLIVAGHCESDVDVEQYLSTDYDRIVFDEQVTFTVEPALEIMSRARTPMSKESIWADGGAQVWGGTNPGGRGALWVKQFYIDKEVDGDTYPNYLPELYDFVPASLADNPYLDQGYRTSLKQMSLTRQRQLLDGDWNAFAGQFFDWEATRDEQPWHVRDMGIAA